MHPRLTQFLCGVLMIGSIVGIACAETEPTPDQWRQRFEQQSRQIEQLNSNLERMQTHVGALESRLERYETRDREQQAAWQNDMARQRDSILAQIEQNNSGDAHGGGYGGYGDGLDITFWGWISYLYSDNDNESTFWAWEVEMDVTKTFTPRIAAGFDIDFVDEEDDTEVEIEQLFLSTIVLPEHETVLTMGKFNAPFGVEARDFWDRWGGSTSLLFRRVPRDLTGIIVTQPIADTGITLQPMLINGIDDDLDVNSTPSGGLVAAWQPCESLRVAWTNIYGPEMADDNENNQYLTLLEAEYDVNPALSVAAEFLYATTETDTGSMDWYGAAAFANYDVNARWRVFGRWSYLNDRDGYLTGSPGDSQEIGVGVGIYIHPLVELRAEYRHDFVDGDDDDSVLTHATFGF